MSMNKIGNINEPVKVIRINKYATNYIAYECYECKAEMLVENGIDGVVCHVCGFMLKPLRKVTRAELNERTNKASTIKANVEVDTEDLDIALGKAKELNRELTKAKALIESMTCKNVSGTITLKPIENIKEVAEYVTEQLRRDLRESY